MTTRTTEQEPAPATTSAGADGLEATEAPGQGGHGFVRDRQHRFPGRKNALKVLYDDTEVAAVRSAAEAAGLAATGFVAAAELTLTGAPLPPALSADRQLLAELLQTRTALGRYGVNLNQAVAALNSAAGAPVWLLQAVAGCARAAGGVDAVTATLARRLG
jgi:2-methylaconitate cis-trans-isomerase PrpF